MHANESNQNQYRFNRNQNEPIIYKTNWKTHLDFCVSIKSKLFVLLNFVLRHSQVLLFSTCLSWKEKRFRLSRFWKLISFRGSSKIDTLANRNTSFEWCLCKKKLWIFFPVFPASSSSLTTAFRREEIIECICVYKFCVPIFCCCSISSLLKSFYSLSCLCFWCLRLFDFRSLRNSFLASTV